MRFFTLSKRAGVPTLKVVQKVAQTGLAEERVDDFPRGGNQ
jgi:hypothetical protein